MIATLAAAALIATYECETAKPVLLTLADGKATATALGLPPEIDRWKFTVRVESGDPLQATIAWPGNPLKAEGKFPALPTSGGSLSILAASAGPCALTEGGCIAQINLVNVGADGASVQIVPSAIGKSGETSIPLLVALTGTCKRGGVTR